MSLVQRLCRNATASGPLNSTAPRSETSNRAACSWAAVVGSVVLMVSGAGREDRQRVLGVGKVQDLAAAQQALGLFGVRERHGEHFLGDVAGQPAQQVDLG